MAAQKLNYGVIVQVGELQHGISQNSGKEWHSRTLVVQTEFGAYPRFIAFRCTGDVAKMAFTQGAAISGRWNVTAREFNGKWYNDIDLFEVGAPQPQQFSTQQQTAYPMQMQQPQQFAAPQPTQAQQQASQDIQQQAEKFMQTFNAAAAKKDELPF